MTTLITFFNNGEKKKEFIMRELTTDMMKEMMNSDNCILSSTEDKRLTKGKIPKKVKNSLGVSL